MTHCVRSSAVSDLGLRFGRGPASVAHLDTRPTGDQEVADSTPPGPQHSFVES